MEEVKNLRKISDKVEELLVETERITENMKITSSYLTDNVKKFDEYIEEQKLLLSSNKNLQLDSIKIKNDLNEISNKIKIDVKKVLITIEKKFELYKKQINDLEKIELKINTDNIEKKVLEEIEKKVLATEKEKIDLTRKLQKRDLFLFAFLFIQTLCIYFILK